MIIIVIYMLRCFLIVSFISFIASLSSSAVAITVNAKYFNAAQQAPLFIANQPLEDASYQSLTMQGYEFDISHTFNERWSASFSHQFTDNKNGYETNETALTAKQKAYGASLYYLMANYTFAIEYNEVSFNFLNIEKFGVTQTKYYRYNEEIDASSFDFTLSRNLDFDNFWLTFDGTVTYSDQQAMSSHKRTQNRAELNSAPEHHHLSQSWLFATSMSWATLWAWHDMAFIPSLNANYSFVVAGDSVYLFNRISGTSSRRRQQRNDPVDIENQEPFASNSLFYWGSSFTVMLTEQLSCDMQFNRIHSDDSTDNYVSFGLGWDF